MQNTMNKLLPLAAVLSIFCLSRISAQEAPAPPRLIIGIVVDQMRYDFLYRYSSKYGSGGFKRLLREGFSCENTHYNFAPTFTGPGHAAIYTGATPSVNGIIANDWYDRQWGKHRYVTADTTESTVGAEGRVGQHSPRVLLSTTITDELRLSNAFKSKVVGVCLKDRGSILPAGHVPDACYWFDDKGGNWITSTYYPDSLGLPQWVQDFNGRRLADQYTANPWTRLLTQPYDESFTGWDQYDDGKYISMPGGFPHDLPALKKQSGYTVLRFTPFGNSLTLDFALEAIEKMELGADAVPDFLCLSFSATDYIGHQWGIHAEETQDAYLRLDADLARLFEYIDQKFGKNNTLVFLTSDHGAAETPVHLEDLEVPAGVFEESKAVLPFNAAIGAEFGKKGDFVLEAANLQVWLDHIALRDAGIELEDASQALVQYLRTQPGVYEAWSRRDLMALPGDYPYAPEQRRGIHPRRSGDVIFNLDPAWHADDKTFMLGGTTHGSPYSYDTHVPLVWHGWRVPAGKSFSPVSITDIAPTLAAMLRIMEPSGSTGKVIEAVVK